MNPVRLGSLVLVALTAACAGRGVPETADPVVAERAVRETAPDRPLRAVFGWRALDGQARFSGEGVARIEPPYRARLDLFGPRGEGYLTAALVDREIRLPADPEVALPPPAMLWALLGVVRPPADAVLEATRVSAAGHEEERELYYEVDGSRLRYVLVGARLRSAEWTGGGRRMIIELAASPEGLLPSTATYRDWSQNTELHIGLEGVEEVEPYPPEIWTPGR